MTNHRRSPPLEALVDARCAHDDRQVQWRLRLTVRERVEVNRRMYALWARGQRNLARAIADRRGASSDAP
jgi:hypothetical protein